MLNRQILALVAATGMGAALALGVGLVVGAPDTALPWAVFGSGGSTTSSSASYKLGSTAGQTAIGSAEGTSSRLGAGFWYGLCVVGSVADDDCDGYTNETACGSNPGASTSAPERIDGAFAGVDDDGDTAVDEALPGGAAGSDCDGDGFAGSEEDAIYAPTGNRDQDACGNDGWAPELVSAVPSDNRVDVLDLTLYITPVRRLNTSPPPGDYSARLDVVPGPSVPGGFWIDVLDLTQIVQLTPPMLGGVRAFQGPGCPWPP